LAAVTAVVINPAELMSRSRDTRRAMELNSIHRNLGLFLATAPSPTLGLANRVYISLPDTSATCASWTGLAPLPTGWSYVCSTPANFRRTDGTGWIPVNFDASAGGSPFAVLPIDPVNNVSHYYTYVTGGSWALSALLESERRLQEQANKDGGFSPGKFEVGTNLRLIALSEGLVGWWPFEEGSGTTARDASKTGNTGTLLHGPTWQPPANCKQGRCLSFDGVDDVVTLPRDAFDFARPFSVTVWFRPTSCSASARWAMFFWRNPVHNTPRNDIPFYWHTADSNCAGETVQNECYINGVNCGSASWRPSPSLLNSWNHAAMTWDGATARIYGNGALRGSVPMSGIISVSSNFTISHPSTAQSFIGFLDEVRVYNRALAVDEISSIYGATK
jgi:hypothetical protein